MIDDIPQPHDEQIEKAIIGCYLQSPSKVSDVVSHLTTEDFYVPAHRSLFRACMELTEQDHNWDLAQFANHLYSTDQRTYDHIGGIPALREMRNSIPTIANVEKYAEIARNLGLNRKVLDMCLEFTAHAHEATATGTPAMLDRLEQAVFNLSKDKVDAGFQHIGDNLDAAMENIEGVAARDPEFCGISTGFREIDKLLMGFKGGEMIVVAARPSIGKTALGLCMLKRIAMFDNGAFPAAMISLETKAKLLTRRHIFEEAGLNPREIFHRQIPPEEWKPKAEAAAERLRKIPLYHYDASNEWPDIRRCCRQLRAQHGVRVIGLDYLQIMQLGERAHSRENEVARMSAGIKALALELDIPIIVFAQLVRTAEGRRPVISELRESGAIEQDADIVALLHRERQTDSVEVAQAVADGKGVETELIIAKNRDGATGVVDLLFFPQFTRFDDPSYTTEEDTF